MVTVRTLGEVDILTHVSLDSVPLKRRNFHREGKGGPDRPKVKVSARF
jgi:phosphotransferase system IIA component